MLNERSDDFWLMDMGLDGISDDLYDVLCGILLIILRYIWS